MTIEHNNSFLLYNFVLYSQKILNALTLQKSVYYNLICGVIFFIDIVIYKL